jgi:hypothetical protein
MLVALTRLCLVICVAESRTTRRPASVQPAVFASNGKNVVLAACSETYGAQWMRGNDANIPANSSFHRVSELHIQICTISQTRLLGCRRQIDRCLSERRGMGKENRRPHLGH